MSIIDHSNFISSRGIDDRGIDELARLQIALSLAPLGLCAVGLIMVSPPVWDWFLLASLFASATVLLVAMYVFDHRWSRTQ